MTTCTEPGCPQCASVVHTAGPFPTIVNAPATVTNGPPSSLPGPNTPTVAAPAYWAPDSPLQHDWPMTD